MCANLGVSDTYIFPSHSNFSTDRHETLQTQLSDTQTQCTSPCAWTPSPSQSSVTTARAGRAPAGRHREPDRRTSAACAHELVCVSVRGLYTFKGPGRMDTLNSTECNRRREDLDGLGFPYFDLDDLACAYPLISYPYIFFRESHSSLSAEPPWVPLSSLQLRLQLSLSKSPTH